MGQFDCDTRILRVDHGRDFRATSQLILLLIPGLTRKASQAGEETGKSSSHYQPLARGSESLFIETV